MMVKTRANYWRGGECGQLLNMGGLSVDRFRDVAAKSFQRLRTGLFRPGLPRSGDALDHVVCVVGFAPLFVLLVGFAVVFDASNWPEAQCRAEWAYTKLATWSRHRMYGVCERRVGV
jgi:hypothetical protein